MYLSQAIDGNSTCQYKDAEEPILPLLDSRTPINILLVDADAHLKGVQGHYSEAQFELIANPGLLSG